MQQNVMQARMLEIRAQQEEQHRREQLTRLAALPKPGPNTVVSAEEAELLVQVHPYAEGEVIGRKRVVGYTTSQQVLKYIGGNVVADARHVPQPGPGEGKPIGWSAQAGRMVRKDEVA